MSVVRYDASCTGEVDYTEFVNNLMESDFKGVANSAHGGRLRNMAKAFSSGGDPENDDENEHHEDSDEDKEEREKFEKMEVYKIFRMIDSDNSNNLDKREVELLMMALGKKFTRAQLDDGWFMIDTDDSGFIDFDEFYEWYTTMGKNKGSPKRK